ncbi:MAG: DUF72 domain-containing protein [Chitinophagaceae bacterium]|nr:DUF72 domain-containing protein [Chitinophagaceae bacterium]
MEFGRVSAEELDKIDFTLPPDPPTNAQVLGGKPVSQPRVYLGCAKWGRTEWVGKIYPPKTKEKDFLQEYVKHYNSIELNATHYKIYGAAGISKWAEKAAGRDFLFCPKMYQGVTHRGSLKGKDFLVTEFLRGVMAFGQRLGPVFIQVSDTFSPKRMEELAVFLGALPNDMQFFVEVRHPDWYLKPQAREGLFSLLSSLNMGAVITDTAGRRECAHMQLTIPKAFIRYVGNSLHTTDYTRTDAWVQRIKHWLDNGMQELYFFMHMHDEATSPELTVELADKLNAACGLNLVKPSFVDTSSVSSSVKKSRQGGLFD